MSHTITQLEKQFQTICRSLLLSDAAKIPSEELPYALERQSEANIPREIRPVCFLSGLSGVGKTTMSHFLVQHGYQKIRNVTTRARRSTEHDTDAYFIDVKTFLQWQERGRLVHPHKRNGVYQAMLAEDIDHALSSSERWFFDKSFSSTKALYELFPECQAKALSIGFLPPAMTTLFARIKQREQDQPVETRLRTEDIFKRFVEELDDLTIAAEVGSVFIVNDELARAQRVLQAWVL